MSGTLCSNLTRALTLTVALIGLAAIAGTARAAFIQGNIVGCAATNAACLVGNNFNSASATLESGSDKTAVFTSGNPEFSTPGLTATFLNAAGASFTSLTLDITPPAAPSGSVNWEFRDLVLMEPGQVFTDIQILSNQGVTIITDPKLKVLRTARVTLTLETAVPSALSSLQLQFLTGPSSATVPGPAPFVLLASGIPLLLAGRHFRP